MYCPENFTRRKILSLHHWELVTLYNRQSRASCTRKTECSRLWNPLRKVCHSKLGADDLFRELQMILINWKLGWLWIGIGVWGEEWGSRVWGMWMWCKEDWINLLSLQCAFIPNGSDMSRAQHYLPSHCTGRGKDARKDRARSGSERGRLSYTWERMAATERGRERETESGSNHQPKNNHNPETCKHIISPSCCQSVSNYRWPWVHLQELGRHSW